MRGGTILLLALFPFLAGCSGTRHARNARAVGIEWVDIPGGEYLMGDTYEGTNQDALPLHRVTVRPFRILRFEVTYRQFDAFRNNFV